MASTLCDMFPTGWHQFLVRMCRPKDESLLKGTARFEIEQLTEPRGTTARGYALVHLWGILPRAVS